MSHASLRGFTARAAGVLSVITVASVVAACGSSTAVGHRGTTERSGPRTGAAAISASAARAHAKQATVAVRKGPLGSYLVGPSGGTLYYFASDSAHKSNCYGTCALGWPVLSVSGRPVAGKGVKASKLGTITRVGGVKQVTYYGMPLYYFVLDAKPGEMFGQDLPAFGGPWWIVNPSNGKPISKAPPAAHVPAPTTAPKSLKLEANKSSALGRYLTDSAGRTLYHFNADKKDQSKCTGLCSEVWPPVLVKQGKATAGKGVKSKLLGTIKLTKSIRQVTYNHMPLYYFALDGGHKGVANGQDQKVAGNTWWAVAPNGSVIHKLIAANGPAAPKHVKRGK